MKAERPILFNAEMVRAILSGRKTQTRRLVMPRPGGHDCDGLAYFPRWQGWSDPCASDWQISDGEVRLWRCPYGAAGDRLWVREKWRTWDGPAGAGIEFEEDSGFKLATAAELGAWLDLDRRRRPGVWRPSIHMPRWASRILLEVVEVRAERLHDITEREAIAEGIEAPEPEPGALVGPARTAFAELWDSINASRGNAASWNANPWVWVVRFRRLEPA